MRAVGLIVEYNPFHNGHLHHLVESRRRCDAEVAVAVMSGHFLQRGEPALFDKWRRTELALAAGVDVVLELPFPWACNSAPQFARGAVMALDALGGGVDTLSFGSEAGEIDDLQTTLALLSRHSDTIALQTARLLRSGMNYPAARAKVVASLPDSGVAAGFLEQPNNILGLEYLRALKETGSAMTAITIPRIGAGYHQQQPVDGIASATGIRHLLRQCSSVDELVPEEIAASIDAWMEEGADVCEQRLFQLLIGRINQGVETLTEIYQVDHGLEHRLIEAADVATDYRHLVDEVKSRQMTRTRIQRTLCYLLNNVMTTRMEEMLARGPLYLHLLGASRRGEMFLARCRKQTSIPIVGNYSRIYQILKRCYGLTGRDAILAGEQLALELKASRNYSVLMRQWRQKQRNRDFYEPVRRG
ncbi:MAG: nucleotidyltransferase [Desulfuromonas sp.]|nr:MAG: nucleotidyltransferase [Desulfuromonas sp.]